MKPLKILLCTLLLVCSFSANALILSDVYSFNAPLVNGKVNTFLFNFADYGYDHRTDTIEFITLSFDFREIVETEEDPADWESLTNWEPIIIYSWIFDGRDVYGDIDTGILTFRSSWNKLYECQFMPWESDVCEENLDLDGIMSSTIVSYNDNLWLGDVRVDIEIKRVPEPAPVLLFGLGLLGLAVRENLSKRVI